MMDYDVITVYEGERGNHSFGNRGFVKYKFDGVSVGSLDDKEILSDNDYIRLNINVYLAKEEKLVANIILDDNFSILIADTLKELCKKIEDLMSMNLDIYAINMSNLFYQFYKTIEANLDELNFVPSLPFDR